MYLLPIEGGTLVRNKSPRKQIGFKDKIILLFFLSYIEQVLKCTTEGMTIDDCLCTYALSDNIKNHQRPVFIYNFASEFLLAIWFETEDILTLAQLGWQLMTHKWNFFKHIQNYPAYTLSGEKNCKWKLR